MTQVSSCPLALKPCQTVASCDGPGGQDVGGISAQCCQPLTAEGAGNWFLDSGPALRHGNHRRAEWEHRQQRSLLVIWQLHTARHHLPVSVSFELIQCCVGVGIGVFRRNCENPGINASVGGAEGSVMLCEKKPSQQGFAVLCNRLTVHG
jgi:hypothetical protein